MRQYRGSRDHILNWVSDPAFCAELTQLVSPSGAVVTTEDHWLPSSHQQTQEARLETFGPAHLPDQLDWPAVRSWWLAHQDGANTPNWDLASTCNLSGRQGLVLVEAKAHASELKIDGKQSRFDASEKSKGNHAQIGSAIEEAKVALRSQFPGINISRDSHYQLSNRISFGWRLASLGVPVVLVYLGFEGDTDIANVGEPFLTSQQWQQCFWSYAKGVVPPGFAEREIPCGQASMWFLIRSRPI